MTEKKTVLLVDDNVETLSTFAEIIGEDGFTVKTAMSAAEALATAREEQVNLVISDLKMPGELSGMDLLEKLYVGEDPVDFIMLTGKGTVETAVKALKMGAYDFLTKPTDPEELLSTIHHLFAYRELENENKRLRADLLGREGESPMVVGPSKSMHHILAMTQAVAPMNTSVLIRGESGTGKEVLADEIHRLSPRSEQRIVKVNCAALPETLLESELFGHEKGSFTGATNRRIGFFEEADGGTIFLDEIAEMSPLLQAKLLRVIQERSFTRVGSAKEVKVDVRLICATNKDLEVAVADGSFREDLYYRINVIQLHLPTLRDRREDIPCLAETLMRRSAVRMGVPAKSFSTAALDKLSQMEFPGNVRELQNVIERAIVFSQGSVIDDIHILGHGEVPDPAFTAHHLPRHNAPSAQQDREEDSADTTQRSTELVIPAAGEMSLEDIEKESIRCTLEANNGNVYKTAKALKISRSTLYNKLHRYDLHGTGRTCEV